MPINASYLLDTGILLHLVRGSKVAAVIDGQFQLRASNFRPLICEVSLGEIEAYADLSSLAKSNGWAIFNGKNDLWVGAATRVSRATLLTTDKDFLPLRDGKHLDVIVLDAMTGWKVL